MPPYLSWGMSKRSIASYWLRVYCGVSQATLYNPRPPGAFAGVGGMRTGLKLALLIVMVIRSDSENRSVSMLTLS